MNNYTKFVNDLIDNQIYERYTKELFEEIKWKFLSYNNDNKYDLLMIDKKNIVRKIEVKKDAYPSENIIIEYKSYDKNSGIRISESDYYVYIFPLLQEVWFIKTKKLKEIIKKYNPEILVESDDCYTIVAAGDGKNTRCYLWNKKTFFNIMGDGVRILKRYDIPII